MPAPPGPAPQPTSSRPCPAPSSATLVCLPAARGGGGARFPSLSLSGTKAGGRTGLNWDIHEGGGGGSPSPSPSPPAAFCPQRLRSSSGRLKKGFSLSLSLHPPPPMRRSRAEPSCRALLLRRRCVLPGAGLAAASPGLASPSLLTPSGGGGLGRASGRRGCVEGRSPGAPPPPAEPRLPPLPSDPGDASERRPISAVRGRARARPLPRPALWPLSP